ncbi:MAG: hypothetical protein JSV39_01235 [Candidatus Aenigmatarchaeota archaeon]|nr:MAG: hypothetical protein JSV39_01235 [Candidatus Aenigmarchaeota archaeon]
MDKRIILLGVFLVIAVGLIMPLLIEKPGTRGPKACNDNVDNDGDNYIDWPDDPGCQNKQDDSELNPNIECDDGIDNDGDDDIDYNDGGCSGPTDDDETNCGDEVCEGGEVCNVCVADCGHCDSCSDTDGGNVITVFGTTSGYLNETNYSHDDYCVDSGSIMEYYCVGDYEQSQQQSCGTDGYVGSNYCLNDSVYRDWRDYFCSSGECDYTDTPLLIEECEWGCTSGTCDPPPDSCSDTDGGYVVTVQGTASGYSGGYPYNLTDECLINATWMLLEYYCVGDYCNNDFYDCTINFTTCSNGACV